MAPAKRRIERVEVVVFCLIVAVAVGVSAYLITDQQRKAKYTATSNNMRSLHCALFQFEGEFGCYPHEKTRPLLMEVTGTELGPWTGSANDCFRQLIAYGIQSEDIFFAVHPEGSRKPDNFTQPIATKAVQAGEVGISYGYGLHSDSNPGRPLLIAPMKTGTHLAHATYGNRIAIWFVGGNQYPCTINRDGEILLPDGTLLFDPARPIWQNRPIDIRHPEFAR